MISLHNEALVRLRVQVKKRDVDDSELYHWVHHIVDKASQLVTASILKDHVGDLRQLQRGHVHCHDENLECGPCTESLANLCNTLLLAQCHRTQQLYTGHCKDCKWHEQGKACVNRRNKPDAQSTSVLVEVSLGTNEECAVNEGKYVDRTAWVAQVYYRPNHTIDGDLEGRPTCTNDRQHS